MISCDVRVSRFPVGSSASSTAGELISARAMADALLLTTRKLRWSVAFAIREPQLPQRHAGSRDPLVGGDRRVQIVEQRQCHILERARAGQEIEVLKYESQALAAQVASSGSGSVATSRSSADMCQWSVCPGAPRIAMSVDLPEPEAPMIADQFAALNLQIHVPQREDVDVPDAIGSDSPATSMTSSDMFLRLSDYRRGARSAVCPGEWPVPGVSPARSSETTTRSSGPSLPRAISAYSPSSRPICTGTAAGTSP